jgi:hypothetical protein
MAKSWGFCEGREIIEKKVNLTRRNYMAVHLIGENPDLDGPPYKSGKSRITWTAVQFKVRPFGLILSILIEKAGGIMFKRLCPVLTVILFLYVFGHTSYAQSVTPKVELGAHLTVAQFRDVLSFDANSWTFGNPPPIRMNHATNAGIGVRGGYNVFSFLTLESELNIFPQDHNSFEKGGRKLQLFYGAKAGLRRERIGLFGKFRPGLVRFGSLIDCNIQGCGTISKKYSAFDIGGVIELYPSSRLFVRFDIGDVVMKQDERLQSKGFPERGDFDILFLPKRTTHSPQFSAGVGIRF